MSDFVLDAAQRDKLNGLNAVVSVRDESGQLLGHFLPEGMFHTLIESWMNSPVTREEIEAARQEYREKGGLPTAEAIALVRRLAGESE